MMPEGNDEGRMTNGEVNPNGQMPHDAKRHPGRDSDLGIPSGFGIRHSSLTEGLIADAAQVADLLKEIKSVPRVAIDTEADSLHSYREKLCLLQLSVPGQDYVLDPLAIHDLEPLAAVLEKKEIVLHGSDFDLRLLRRSINFRGRKVFDTVIAARLLGIREFSLAALVKRYFDVELPKGSQKANWARRPLPKRMFEYAVNDTRYLLPLAERLESELRKLGRLEWFRQSCQRAVEQASIERLRAADELWRISGSGALRGRAAAVLRELWYWREKEAEAINRPSFHVLQNDQLLRAAASFDTGSVPDYRHFSSRRRASFLAAAERAMAMDESQWPVAKRRFRSRRSPVVTDRAEELKRRRDEAAAGLKLEPAFVAPRASLEAIANDPKNAESLLVPWQRKLLEIGG
jgi:ribonuclease D